MVAHKTLRIRAQDMTRFQVKADADLVWILYEYKVVSRTSRALFTKSLTAFLVKQSLYPLSHRGLLRASRSDARLRCSQFLVPTMVMLQANRSCACDFHAHAFVLRVRLSCVRFASQKTSPKAYSKKCEGVSISGAREMASRRTQRHQLVRHHSL